jgi:3'-5' exoribonuclease
LEVAQAAIALARPNVTLANRALVAALFHDYGKIHEYAFTADGVDKLPFQRRTGHVVWSWAAFLEMAKNLTPEETEDIGHALLAHHGRREWGSPVEPQTRLAYIIHTADMMSARGIQ